MIKVTICSDHAGDTLSGTVIRACQKNGGAVIRTSISSEEGDDNALFSINTDPNSISEDPSSIIRNNDPQIIVYGRNITEKSIFYCNENAICIIDSSDIDLCRQLRKRNIRTIGCSMSGCDTISLSGVGKDGMYMVTVGRTIKTIGGKLIDPCEIKVSAGCTLPLYPIMAACTVVLLGGASGEDYVHI